MVQRIFDLRADGTSIRRIAQILNSDGIPSARGKLWRKNVINRIISNPVYYGAACWGKTTSSRILAFENGVHVPYKVQKFMRRVERAEWTINERAGIPAIVTKEVWDKANLVCRAENKVRGKSLTSRYLFSGLLFDQATGSTMVGSDGGRYTLRDGTEKRKRYYVNNGWHSQGVQKGIKTVPAEPLEEKVTAAIRDNLASGRIVTQLEAMVTSYFSDRHKNSGKAKQLRSLDRQIDEKKVAIQNLLRAIQLAEGVESLIPALKVAEKDLKDLQLRRIQLKESQGEASPLPTAKDVGKIVAAHLLKFDKVFSAAPMDERKSFVRNWIERVEVFEREGRKKARALLRLIPNTAEFKPLCEKVMLSGPCRARTYDPQIMSLLL